MCRRRVSSLILAAAMSLLAAASFAQVPPYVHGTTVGTSPIQALATNPLRRKIYLFNPNASALLAYCPAGPNRDTGSAVTCAINGAGSITLQPYTGMIIEGSLPSGQRLDLSSAWNVVANSGGSTYTAIDLE